MFALCLSLTNAFAAKLCVFPTSSAVNNVVVRLGSMVSKLKKMFGDFFYVCLKWYNYYIDRILAV